MHDAELWARWYIWLLALPVVVIGTLIRDWVGHVACRARARGREARRLRALSNHRFD